MLGRCLKDKSTDFKTVFTNNLPDSLWTLDSNLPNDKIMSGKTADSSSPLSSVDNGIQGKAVQLKGNVALRLSDYKDECLVNNSMALTVSLWLKYGNSTSENQTFFTLGKDTTTDGGDRLQISQPNKTLDEVGVLLNSDRGRLFLRFPCPWNIWSHIVVTWNSTESFVIYRWQLVLLV
ncbi:uncharacterized protein LOC110235389 [Exaiptasia diaphana]|uniref:Uncharacterized protein n=1 Tax=Exaiptasia diaphana TaxID=2652724 RepID=A0A913YEM3_EXADI|nr:uncharacterized protein LOC110235389 [Exaiptasia diaphana]